MSVDVESKDIRTNCAHWLHLAQNRDQWRNVQNTAMEIEAFLDRLSNASMDS